MKKVSILCFWVFFCQGQSPAQNASYIVSNNKDDIGFADFSNLADAIATVDPDDTL